MAIKKNLEVKGGINLAYWRVYRIGDLNYNTGKMVVVIVGYVSKDARDSEPDGFLSSMEFTFDMPFDNNADLREYSYLQIIGVENSIFADGVLV